MVKICQTRPLKLNFEIIPKKRIFWFLLKISAGHAWSWKNFLADFQILGPLGCQGWVVIPQNVKKVKITAPYCICCWTTKNIPRLRMTFYSKTPLKWNLRSSSIWTEWLIVQTYLCTYKDQMERNNSLQMVDFYCDLMRFLLQCQIAYI